MLFHNQKLDYFRIRKEFKNQNRNNTQKEI